MSNFVDVAQAIQIKNLQMLQSQAGTMLIEQKNQQQQKFVPPVPLKLLVAYLYFIQGVVMALPETMTMVYPQLPPYQILSIFSAASVPFSIKFLVAPLIQKFTKISYGKRKTWIIISQLITSTMLFVASFFTNQKYQIIMAMFLICIVFLITLQDISLDALAIKELRLPHLVGFLQAIMQTSGVIIGSLLLLKLTSMEFAQNIGLSEPICHPSLVFRIVSILIFLTTFVIHFLYQERTLKSERRVNKKKFCEILKYYKVFFDYSTKYCRTTLLFLVYMQGFNLYQAGYEFELIKAGFKRNTFNTISNISLVPISILACLYSQKIQKFGLLRSFLTYLILRQTLAVTVLTFFPTTILPICIIYFCNQALEVFKFILIGILVNSFPVNGISGMLITMLVSGANFGSLKTISLILTGKLGWRVCATFGLIIQIGLISVFPALFRNAEQGIINFDIEMNEESSSDSSQDQKQIQFSSQALNQIGDSPQSMFTLKQTSQNQ